jgi:hypothetical protein
LGLKWFLLPAAFPPLADKALLVGMDVVICNVLQYGEQLDLVNSTDSVSIYFSCKLFFFVEKKNCVS